MEKLFAFGSAAGAGAVIGAFAISGNALTKYLGAEDGSPLSAKMAAALAVHMLATVVMFVVACVVGSTVYLVVQRLGFASYLTTGLIGFAAGVIFAPTIAMALGGAVAGVIFHWQYTRAATA